MDTAIKEFWNRKIYRILGHFPPEYVIFPAKIRVPGVKYS
jgi:hypothetical protein